MTKLGHISLAEEEVNKYLSLLLCDGMLSPRRITAAAAAKECRGRKRSFEPTPNRDPFTAWRHERKRFSLSRTWINKFLRDSSSSNSLMQVYKY